MGKIGRHEQVLAIYTYILNDPLKAEEYCFKTYDHTKENAKDVSQTSARSFRKYGQQYPSIS